MLDEDFLDVLETRVLTMSVSYSNVEIIFTFLLFFCLCFKTIQIIDYLLYFILEALVIELKYLL